MANFMTGFAEGYINAADKRREREADKENLQFKYRMDALTEKRTLREQQKLQEVEWTKQAKIAAERIGDPSFATEAYKQFAAGRTVEQVFTDIDSGSYSRDPNYQRPATTVKFETPKGVAPEEQGDTSYRDPAVSAQPSEPEGLMARGKRINQERMDSRIDERIRDVDPTLLDDEVETAQVDTTGEPTGWVYKNKNEVELPPEGDVRLRLAKAQQTGDKSGQKEAELQLSIWNTIHAEETKRTKDAEGKNTGYFFRVGSNNRVGTMFLGEVQETDEGNVVFDVSNPTQEKVVTEDFIAVSEDGLKEYQQVAKDFGTAAKDYNVAKDEFKGALSVSADIVSILERNPEVTTLAGQGAKYLNQLEDEVKGIANVLDQQGNEIEQQIGTGNTEGLQAKIYEYEKQAQNLLSTPNKSLAQDVVEYETLRKLAAFKYAAANGVSGQGMSDRDFREFYEATGGSKNKEAVIKALQNNAASVFAVLDSARMTLDKNQQVRVFEDTYLQGKSSGLRPGFIGDDLAPRMRPFFEQAYAQYKQGLSRNSSVASGGAEQTTKPAAQEQPQSSYEAGKSYTFRTKDGKTVTKTFKGGNYKDPNSWE